MVTPEDPAGYQLLGEDAATLEDALEIASAVTEHDLTEHRIEQLYGVTFAGVMGTLAAEVQRLRDIRKLESPRTAWDKVHNAPQTSMRVAINDLVRDATGVGSLTRVFTDGSTPGPLVVIVDRWDEAQHG